MSTLPKESRQEVAHHVCNYRYKPLPELYKTECFSNLKMVYLKVEFTLTVHLTAPEIVLL